MKQSGNFEEECPKGGTCEMEVGLVDIEGGSHTKSRCKKCGRDMSVELSVGLKEAEKNK